MEDEEEEPRGRSRSASFREDDDDDDVGEGERSGRGRGRSEAFDDDEADVSGGAGAGAVKKKAGTALSRKTIAIVSDLQGQGGPGRRGGDRLSPEQLEEKRLEVLEAQRRKAPSSKREGAKGRPAKDDKKGASYDHYIKLLLLGDSGVGKTSLLNRFCDDDFSVNMLSTAGVDYKNRFMQIDGKRIKCQIWDTAGQERFRVITRAYYKGAHGIVLCFDVADEETFTNIGYWMSCIQSDAAANVEKVLVGNKIDLPGRQIRTAQGTHVASQYGITYFETSAKESVGVGDAFEALVKNIIKRNPACAQGSAGVGAARPLARERDAGGAGAKKKGGGKGGGKGCNIL